MALSIKKVLGILFFVIFIHGLHSQSRDIEMLAVENLSSEVTIGKQYALIIAIDSYRFWGALKKPVEDAKEIRDILRQDYFIDEFIELYNQDATKANITKTFTELQTKLDVHDSLFIYFAGHGHLDKNSNSGFWIPVDGGTDEFAQENWLANSQIRGYISRFKTIHVFLVSDSCFSGDILNSRSIPPQIDNAYYRRGYSLTSREVLTSGSIETVPDQSEFSEALKMTLRKNTAPLIDPMTIYNDVKLAVEKTTPLYGTLAASNHQNGAAFLFFKKNSIKQALPVQTARPAETSFVNQEAEVFPQLGNSGLVWSVAYSPDGKRVISGSSDKKIKMWDAENGREAMTFSGHTDQVNSVCFSPDGRYILSASNDRTLKLWDAASGLEIRTFSGHSGFVYSAVFSPDGKYILSASSDSTLKLWNAASGLEIRTLTGHTGSVYSAAFRPDGRRIVSGSSDNTLKVWDAENGNLLGTLSGHTDQVITVCFSPDGKHILSAGSDSTIRQWDAENGYELKTFFGHSGSVNSLSFNHDGKHFFSASDDMTIRLWDIESGEELIEFLENKASVYSVSISPDGNQILSGSWDGTVRLLDISSGGEIMAFISFLDDEWVAITPDGYYAASPFGDKYIKVRAGNYIYSIDSYRIEFYNPDVIKSRLQGLPDPAKSDIRNVLFFRPPEVVIRSPDDGDSLNSEQASLSVTVIDQGQPITDISVLVNGRLVGSDEFKMLNGSRGITVEDTGLTILGNENRVNFRMPLRMDAGSNLIEVIARNPYSTGRESVNVNYIPAEGQEKILPALWMLSVGVNRFESDSLANLQYAANDAIEIANVFKGQEGRVYNKVNYLLIADGEEMLPTRENIVKGLSFLKKAGQRDVILLFIAGQAINDDNGNYFYLPSDTALNPDGSIIFSSAISHHELQQALDMPGHKLLFIDTCYSDITRLQRNLSDNSTVVFASSRSDELSLESWQVRHGVFTYAILKGMKGQADISNKGTVSLMELIAYVTNDVRQRTNGQQNPVAAVPGYTDFILADLRE